jgi:sialic acid synthase SpsE
MLIAEIGNVHLGDMQKAKDLIKAAHESGADIIKSQAFLSRDITGSMPREFYRKCEFAFHQYVELIHYAKSIGNDLFYSIFSRSLEALMIHQTFHKVAGGQTAAGFDFIEKKDAENVIVSVREGTRYPDLKRAQILYVSDYLTKFPGLQNIKLMSEWYGRQAGYSDHTVGIDTCKEAIEKYGADVIEKHFTITRDITYEGVQYRDAVHSALPKEFEQLARFHSNQGAH